MFQVRPKTPAPPEDPRDWADSPLYKFVSEQHVKELVAQGKIKFLDDEHRDPTPLKIHMMTKEEKEAYNLNPNKLPILNQIECAYFSQLLIKQLDENNQNADEKIDLQNYYKRAKHTIEVLATNMVKPIVENHTFFEKFSEVNAANVVTLLLRGKQLYETHKEATQIMKLITEVEQAFKP